MSTEAETAGLVKARLLRMREQLQERLARLQADKRRELEPLSIDSADRATQRENDEVVDSIERATRAELREIDAVLRRIEIGRYGWCESCGARIEARRLAAIPYARRCQNCATTL